MTRESYLLLFLGITMVISSFSMYHITNAQIDSSVDVSSDITAPVNPTPVSNSINGDDKGIDNINDWTVIFGNWTVLDGSLQGGSLENSTGLLNNTILNPEITDNPTEISTSFKVDDIDNTTANYASIVYSFTDSNNYKLAGINIYDNAVYAVGYTIANGNQVAEPFWPGIKTDLTWTPGATFNLNLVNQGSSLALLINGTEYITQSIDNTEIELRDLGLNYGRINDISFLDYETGIADQQVISDNIQNNSTQGTFTTRDTQTILLDGEGFPANSYIHLYDATPYQIASGHISAKLPCNDDSNTEVTVLTGQAPTLVPIELEYISDLSTAGETCLYRADINSSESNPITDIAIGNNSPDDIDFPETSSIAVSVGEISRIE